MTSMELTRADKTNKPTNIPIDDLIIPVFSNLNIKKKVLVIDIIYYQWQTIYLLYLIKLK